MTPEDVILELGHPEGGAIPVGLVEKHHLRIPENLAMELRGREYDNDDNDGKAWIHGLFLNRSLRRQLTSQSRKLA